MKNLPFVCFVAAITAVVVTIVCKTLGVGDASMVIGGGVGGAVGTLIGLKNSSVDEGNSQSS